MELTVFDKKLYTILSPDAPLQKLADGFQFTEGPVRRGDAIYFTDFYRDRIYRYDARQGVSLVTDDSHRTIGMTCTADGRILGCASNLHAICDVESGEILADSFFGIRLNGTNDVIQDSRGRVWFSDPYVREFEGRKLGRSFVFCLDKGVLSPVCWDLPWPNGLALSPDEQTLYLIDSRQLRLYAVTLATGARRVLVQFSKGMGPGLPDGMRVRADGTIFVAGPGGISVIAPEGKLLGRIHMPEVAANLCFDETGLFLTASTGIYHLDLIHAESSR